MGRTRAGLALLLLPAAAALAQTTGRIEGVVRDGAGGALSGAVVQVSSASLQAVRTATTDREGRYRLAALPPGVYAVRTELSGFRRSEKQASVFLDATATVDFTLEPAVEEQVAVGGEAPVIDVVSTTTGTSYTSEVVNRLPVGRNYADIVKSNPGVDTDRGDTQGRSLALTVYGATSAENQWMIDGINTTNVIKGVQGKAINNEFVEEVQVKTGGYQAEYGRALGGIVNVITKSGGNVFHGDGFAYYDSSGTAAHQVLKPEDGLTQMRIADSQRLDYGADLGGSIVKDRLWFFAAYNRVGFRGHVSTVANFGDVTPSDRFPLDSTDDLYSGKLTWNATPPTTVVATVFADPSTNSGASGADPRQGPASVMPIVSLGPSTWFSTRKIGGTDFGARVTQLLGSSAVLTLQGALHRDRYDLNAANTIRYEDWTCTGGTPAQQCSPPQEPNSVTGGYGGVAGRDDHNSSRRQQYRADTTFYWGNHEIKAGGDYQDGVTDGLGYYSGGQFVRKLNEYGQTYYAHQFVAVSPEDPTLLPGYPPHAQVIDFGIYVQDSWKVSPGLTVNLGLRWDGEDTRNFLGSTVLRLRDGWQPRLGVVWDPWRDGRTKLYAFAGRFSYAFPTIAAVAAFHGYTILETYNFDPVSVVQDLNVLNHSKAALINGGGTIGDPVDAGLKGPYQDELTLGVERMLDPTLLVSLKGTYRRLGAAIEERCDFVATGPSNTCAIINPGSSATYASGQAPTCNGLFDNPAWYQCPPGNGPATPPAKRIYRGIEVLARKTLGDRFWLQASYVYSSLRGNYDGGVNESGYGQTSVGTNSDFDYPAIWHNGYGALYLDRPHRFRLDGFWVTPWRLSIGLQAYAESGAPLNRLGFFNSSYVSIVFLVPRGSAGRLPTLWEANLTLSYPIVAGPVAVTLQAYLFNVFDNQIATARDEAWSASPPDGFPATIYDPNQMQKNPDYGRVTERSTPRSFRAALRVSF
jgi:hypothetical protein